MNKNVIFNELFESKQGQKVCWSTLHEHVRNDFAGPKTLRVFWDSRPGLNKLKVKHRVDPPGHIVNDG